MIFEKPLMKIIALPDDTFDIRLALIKSNGIHDDGGNGGDLEATDDNDFWD